MQSIYLRWWGCGAFDIRFGDLNIAVDPYLFDENLANAEPIYDYIFISHEHFDHCHPETLRRLCRGDRFQRLFVPIGCLAPQEPVSESYRGAAFTRDLPIDKHISREKIEVLYPKYRTDSHLDQGTRTFPGPFEVNLGPLQVEVVESGENIRPHLPTNGYLFSHREKEVSVYHMGDLHEVYPALANLKGRVDFVVHMKLGFKDWSILPHFLDLVEPRFWIPTHYRTDRKSDPIPEGHWPPNLDDPAAFIEEMREVIGQRTRILPFTAGIEYEIALPSKQVQWRWQWVNSWSTPPWQEGS
jgi:L-ascorbate metabolism protein UlaG (beta-lactamase superfamily)